MSNDQNDQLVLICGTSASGKSASLRNIRNQERWLFMNTEAGKRLPFKNNFRSARVDDPMQVLGHSTGQWNILMKWMESLLIL